MRKTLVISLVVAAAAIVVVAVVTGATWALIALAVLLVMVVFNELGGSPSARRWGGVDPGRDAAAQHARNQGWTDL